MNFKRRLIEMLPDTAKRAAAVPYDLYQTKKADRAFASKDVGSLQPSSDAPEHVVFVVVDALRGDAVDPDVTPFFDGLDGTTDALTPGTWTFPAVSSILTGLYPFEHGATRRHDDYIESFQLPPRMDEDRRTLTEVLAAAGYRTYGGFGHDTPFVALSGRFHRHRLYHKVNSTAADVFDDYLDWLESRQDTRTFSFLHLAEPHIPVDPPDIYRSRHGVENIEGIENWRFEDDVDCEGECRRYRENRKKLYQASVDYVDDEVAKLYERLDNLLDDVVFVVTSDHGEALWDDVEFDVERFDGTGCVDHGGAPYECITRVPLLADGLDVSEDRRTSLVDLAPTLLEMAGLDDALETSGVSLRRERQDEGPIFVEGSTSGHEKKAVYASGWKLMSSPSHGVEEFFGMPEDELGEPPEEVASRLVEALPEFPGGAEQTTHVSGLTERRLEDLGYR